MNILQYQRNEVVALADRGMTREKNVEHWDICADLCKGKTIEQVAEDHRMSSRNVEYIKARKCKKCP